MTGIPSIYDQLAEQRAQPQAPAPAPQPAERTVYDDLLDRQQQQADLLRVASFNAAVKSDANKAAEAQRIGKQLGLPSDAAERNLDEVRAISAQRDYENRNLAAFSPILDRQLRDPEFARIAHDDLDRLSTWEGMVRGFSIGQLETEQGMLGERLRSGQATPAEIDRLAAVRTQLQALPRPGGFLAGSAKIVGQQAVTLPKALEVGLASGMGAAGVAMVAGQAGPQALVPEEVLTVPGAFLSGLGLGTAGAMAVQAYQMEAGSAYLDMVDRGYDRGAASSAAVGVGVANAALELVGMKLLAKGAGITGQALREALGAEVRQGVAQALVRPTLGRAALQFAKGYGTGLGGEVATETLQEGVNIVAEELARRFSENPAALESTVTRGEVIRRLVETATETAQGMALLAVPGPSMHLWSDSRRAAAAEQRVREFRAESSGAASSNLRRRSPEGFEQFAKAAVAGTGAENRFVDAQAFSQVLRQADLEAGEKGVASAADTLRAALPEVMQQAEEAMRTGGDVAIPAEKYATYIAGTPLDEQLIPHLRSDADAMSFAEAEAFKADARQLFANAEQQLKESAGAEQEFRASALRAEEGFRQQLLAVQPLLQPRDARAVVSKRSLGDAAKLYRTMVEVQALAMGVTPEVVAERVPLRVLVAKGELPAQAAKSGSKGAYAMSSFTILLATKANFSTVVHELGHHHLHMLGKIAGDAELAKTAPLHSRSVEQMGAFLKWRGIQDVAAWNGMSLEEQRPHHEAFAYAFEMWLHEGKAPTEALGSLFRRVARWMQKVYEVIRTELNAAYRDETGQDLPVLTDENRQMFGLMLSTEQDVRERAAATGALDSFRSMREAGMTPEEWVAHQAQVDDAEDSAIAAHQQDRLRDLQWFQGAEARLLREKQRTHDALRRTVRSEVETDLRVQPVYRALRWLTHGDFIDVDGVSTPAEGPHKLQTDAAKALAPAGAVLKTGRYGIVSKDGLHPDQAARLFGFPTGADLVRAVVTATEFDAAVDSRTTERMLTEHAELADPKKRQESVDKALHGDYTARLIATDYRHLQKALPPVRQLVAWAKSEAERLMAGRQLWQARRQDHLAGERRAAQRFQAAMAKGDIPAAAEAQRVRLLQHMLVREATAAQEDADVLRETLAGFLGSDERLGKTRDFDLVVLGRAIAARYGMRPSFTSKQDLGQMAAAREVLKRGWPSLGDRVANYLPQPGSQATPLENLTVAEMRELQEVAAGLWEIAGDAKTVELQGQKVEKEARVRALAATAGERVRMAPGSKPPTEKSTTVLQRGLLGFWQVKASVTRLEHWALWMDGGEPGPFTNTFIVPVRQALATYWKARDAMIEAVHPRLRELRKQAGELWDAELAVPQQFLVQGKLTFRGKKELMGALLHVGTESNLEKLLVPYGFAPPPEQTNGVLDTSRWDAFLSTLWHGENPWITQADLDYVQFIWGLYREKLPMDQAAYRKLHGVEFVTLETRKVTTPWGVIEGGYVPAYTDQFMVNLERPRKSDLVEDEQRAFTYSVSTGKGHTIQRNPFYRQKLALDVSRQVVALDTQMRFAHLQPTLSEIMRIVRDREFERAVGDVDRSAINQIIVPSMENAALQTSSRPGKSLLLDVVANALRHTASLQALGFNLFNGLVQATGFSNARSAVKGRYLRAGIVHALRNPPEAVATAMAMSDVMRERLEQRTRRMREEIAAQGKGGEFGRTWKSMQQAAGRWAFLPQRLVQGAVDLATWHGAYQQAIAESKADGSYTEEQAHRDAVQHADGVVRRTQGSNNPEDLANYEADTPFMKLFTQFGSYSNVVLNQVMGAGEGVSPRLRAALWVLLTPALLEVTLRMLVQGAPGDDDGDGQMDEIALAYAKGLARNVAGMVPFAGPAAMSLAQSDGTRMMETPAGSAVRQIGLGLWSFFDAAAGDATPTQTRAIGTVLTLASGLPLHVVTRAVAFEQQVGSGKVDPQGVYDQLFGILTGQATEAAKR